jgi:hypothetical protein
MAVAGKQLPYRTALKTFDRDTRPFFREVWKVSERLESVGVELIAEERGGAGRVDSKKRPAERAVQENLTHRAFEEKICRMEPDGGQNIRKPARAALGFAEAIIQKEPSLEQSMSELAREAGRIAQQYGGSIANGWPMRFPKLLMAAGIVGGVAVIGGMAWFTYIAIHQASVVRSAGFFACVTALFYGVFWAVQKMQHFTDSADGSAQKSSLISEMAGSRPVEIPSIIARGVKMGTVHPPIEELAKLEIRKPEMPNLAGGA